MPHDARRIVHLSDCYLPRLGGIEMQVHQLATRQAALGHDVHIVTATPGGETVEHSELTVHRVVANLPFDLPVHPRTSHHVEAILRELASPNLVAHAHAGVVSPFAWGALRAASTLRVPTVATVHSVWGPVAQPGFRVADSVLRWSKRGVQLAAVSGVAAARIQAAVGDSVTVLVTPNGVDPEKWQVTPEPHAPNDVHAVAVMRLAPRKRALPLLSIVRESVGMLPARVHLRLTMVGDGPDRSRAVSFARDHDLAVDFAGRLTHDEIRHLYASADVFVQPSVRESFGLAALEARTAGLPVLARAETGISEFVTDGVEGLLVSSDHEMAVALARLALDVDLRQRMATHNRTVEPEQTWPRVLDDVDDAYEAARELVR